MFSNHALKKSTAGVLAACFLVSSVVFVPVEVHAAEKFPETNLKTSCFENVWSPSTKSVAKDSKWRGDGADRIGYTSSGPNGKESMVSKAFDGVPAAMASLKLPTMKGDNVKVARLMTVMYIPENNGFNTGNAKLPLGLWGGDGNCIAGGCPPPEDSLYPEGVDQDRTQNGFSVRLTRTADDTNASPVPHSPKIYTYNLNRTDVPVSVNPDTGVVSVFGQSEIMNGVTFPTGQWFKVIMDVRLNSFKSGVPQANGFVDLYLYTMNDRLIGQAHQNGLILRDNPSWYINGPYLVDLWGGGYTNPENTPMATFKTYYRNYKMLAFKDGLTPSQCKN